MARAIWSGVLTFGLVSVPVELYTATEAHEPTFHQFQKGTSDRIRYKRVNERTGREVDFGNIAKGAEVGRGRYVMLEQQELESVAPGRSRSMEIDKFVELDEIDPIYFAKAYYLGPANEETKKIYALLRDAMAQSNRAALAAFVMRNKEYLATIRADGDVLVLETMYFADEIRDPHDEVRYLPGRIKLRPNELEMAQQLIASMSGKWEPAAYRDTYAERVQQLIKAKKDDKEYEPAPEAPAATEAGDLLEALRRSVESAKKGGGSARKSTPRKSASRKTATRKSTARKSTARKSTARKTAAARKSGGRSAA
ncbi:MAG TPA: Ku protein [Jatrophihabitans sp.]|nr:Ku protein [Jatrophihabitans sp.]